MTLQVLGEHGRFQSLRRGWCLGHAVPLSLAELDGLPAWVKDVAQDAVLGWRRRIGGIVMRFTDSEIKYPSDSILLDQ